MPATDAALASYEEQVRIVAAAVVAATEVWGRLDPGNFSASWVREQVGDRLFLTTARAQELAATAADTYTDLILAEQGIEVPPTGEVIPTALAGVASDGRELDSLLLQPLITASVAQAGGATLEEAMATGLSVLTRIVGTQVQDASRTASSMSIAARPRVGWVRLVSPKACARCAILAGKWFRWNQGFLRHPLCNCRHIPARENASGDLRTDPQKLFSALTEAEQNKQFTKAGAQAIRDGADMNQVVNARRGALGLSSPGRLTAEEQKILKGGRDHGRLQRTDVYGRPVFITREGTTKSGVAGKLLIEQGGSVQERSGPTGRRRVTRARTPRLMPESIMELATDRDDAIRLLRRFGYMK